MSKTVGGGQKLYEHLAASIAEAIGRGTYLPGARLPPERDLAEEFGVSRPTVREALLALQIRGLVEPRHGSGVYVVDAPAGEPRAAGPDIGAFELIEARALIEGETAALAATAITDAELEQLDLILQQMQQENQGEHRGEESDRSFHLAIAAATRNAALAGVVEGLWDLRYHSPACHDTLSRARRAGVRPRVDEHRAVFEALKARDPQAARKAMRAHLERVINELVVAAEVEAVEAARREAAATRSEYERRRSI